MEYFKEEDMEMCHRENLSLILFTDNSLEKISSQIGYKSTASFYCHFKEAYKMTPDQYRKLHA